MLGWIEDGFHVAPCQEEVFPVSRLVNKAGWVEMGYWADSAPASPLQPKQHCFVLPYSVFPRAFSEQKGFCG